MYNRSAKLALFGSEASYSGKRHSAKALGDNKSIRQTSQSLPESHSTHFSFGLVFGLRAKGSSIQTWQREIASPMAVP